MFFSSLCLRTPRRVGCSPAEPNGWKNFSSLDVQTEWIAKSLLFLRKKIIFKLSGQTQARFGWTPNSDWNSPPQSLAIKGWLVADQIVLGTLGKENLAKKPYIAFRFLVSFGALSPCLTLLDPDFRCRCPIPPYVQYLPLLHAEEGTWT